jgi:uroporphyrinogen-III synthase
MPDTTMLTSSGPVSQVLVTRPAREAQRWVAQLQARGFDAFALPLIDIGPMDDLRPIQEAWQHLGEYAAVMFVSANAVAQFFEAKVAIPSLEWCSEAINTRAWSTGPGTSAALQLAGLARTQIDAPGDDATQFDSEALWARVGAKVRPGQRVLIVRGGDATGQGTGRDWLADRLADAGGLVDRLIAYRRLAPVLSEAQRAQARRAATDGAVWVFSSSEAVGHLVRQFPAQGWNGARAVATHPRIAETVRRAGFGVVCESRPTLDAVVSSIKSLE